MADESDRESALRPASGETAATATASRAGWSRRLNTSRWLKPVVFLFCLLPFGLIVFAVENGTSGGNPIEYVERETGIWTLRLLLLSLLATPLSILLKQAWPVRLRRMLGLYVFFYALVHLLAYAVLDQSLNVADILGDIVERPFVTVGFLAFLIFTPLAFTSNRWAVKRLGRAWKSLHQWVYVAAVLSLLHYVWLAKGDRLEPLVYLLLLIVLLGYRLMKLIAQEARN